MEKELEGVYGKAIVRIDGSIENMSISENIDREEFAIMIATIFGGPKTLMEELKIGDVPKITIKNDAGIIEIERNDVRRLLIKIVKK